MADYADMSILEGHVDEHNVIFTGASDANPLRSWATMFFTIPLEIDIDDQHLALACRGLS